MKNVVTINHTLPLKGGHVYFVEPDLMAAYRLAYPQIDVEQEISKMNAWLISNPDRQKTKRGIKRFINSWLSRARPQQNNVTQQQDFITLHTDSSWADGL